MRPETVAVIMIVVQVDSNGISPEEDLSQIGDYGVSWALMMVVMMRKRMKRRRRRRRIQQLMMTDWQNDGSLSQALMTMAVTVVMKRRRIQQLVVVADCWPT